MLRLFIIACLLIFSGHLPAVDSLDTLLDNSHGASGLDGGNSNNREIAIVEAPTFLPVDEAYQLTITHKTNPETRELLLHWVIADGYFLYGDKFFFKVNGKSATAELSEGEMSYDPIFDKDVAKHYLFAEARLSGDNLPAGSGFELSVSSQGCSDGGYCYPPRTQHFFVDGPRVSAINPPITDNPVGHAGAPGSVATATTVNWAKTVGMLAFAIIGGVILNFMPCVLPVLSLKALSLAKTRDNHRLQGWSYTLGVVTTFLAVAAVLLWIRATGQAVGWGFQLQSPGFVSGLILLFFVMGLSLSGYVNLGARWMGVGQSLTEGSGPRQSYFTGVLAAVVASPCTAPFMASALGFAITQPWWLALSVFGGLGLGMALPLLLLSYLPQLGRWLPKPGAWMDTFKQALAFPLYLTAIWLLWVLGRQVGVDAAMVMVLACLLIVFVFWLGRHWASMRPFTGVALLVLIAWFIWHGSQQSPVARTKTSGDWEPYSASRLQELRDQGKAVFINMTADWCITCLANEKLVFTDEMIATMKTKGIHLIKGDWTNYDPEITRMLEQYDRGGVPLYLLFPPEAGAKAQILPQILSPSLFAERIRGI